MKKLLFIPIILILLIAFTSKTKTEIIAINCINADMATTIINKQCNNGWTLDKTITSAVAIAGGASSTGGRLLTRQINGEIILIFKR
jgi:hypothetical protein